MKMHEVRAARADRFIETLGLHAIPEGGASDPQRILLLDVVIVQSEGGYRMPVPFEEFRFRGENLVLPPGFLIIVVDEQDAHCGRPAIYPD
jgi:hypothetical protein